MGEDKQSCSPENMKGVADELRKLADQIEDGKVTVGGVNLSLCNAVSLKVKQKLVAGQVKFNISLTASISGSESAPSAPEAQTQKKKAKTPKDKKKSRPYEVKKLKKALAQQWKQVSAAIAAQKTPDPALVTDFLDICEEYGERAEDEWQPLWHESVESMKKLISFSQEGNFQEATQILSTINNQKKSCHKKFK